MRLIRYVNLTSRLVYQQDDVGELIEAMNNQVA